MPVISVKCNSVTKIDGSNDWKILMGKRLSKKELLAEINDERSRLMELVDTIAPQTITKPGINQARWSIKDVMTHLLDWERRVVHWCELGKQGKTPETPGEGFNWSQLPELNAQIQRKHRRKSVKRVLAEFEQAHEETLALIRTLNNRQLTTVGYYSWTGKSWTVSDYLRGNTASHYRWARNKIRKWLATLD